MVLEKMQNAFVWYYPSEDSLTFFPQGKSKVPFAADSYFYLKKHKCYSASYRIAFLYLALVRGHVGIVLCFGSPVSME